MIKSAIDETTALEKEVQATAASKTTEIEKVKAEIKVKEVADKAEVVAVATKAKEETKAAVKAAAVTKVLAASDSQVSKWTSWRNKLSDADKYLDVVIAQQDSVGGQAKSTVEIAAAVTKVSPAEMADASQQ